jgi:hypothetical protein
LEEDFLVGVIGRGTKKAFAKSSSLLDAATPKANNQQQHVDDALIL